ncbi:MAG: hypothetical protein ACJ75H_17935 [Thermoanaerobaculia bacterium]
MASRKRSKDRKVPITQDDPEAWLYRNPEALAVVRRGLQESAEGKAVFIGSFASYADE